MPISRSTRAAVPLRGGGAATEQGVNWRHRAACVGQDPELFFPITSTGPGAWEAEQAKAVCQRCPVATPCLAWALEAGIDHGVWGGRTEEERRSIRRRTPRGRTSPAT